MYFIAATSKFVDDECPEHLSILQNSGRLAFIAHILAYLITYCLGVVSNLLGIKNMLQFSNAFI